METLIEEPIVEKNRQTSKVLQEVAKLSSASQSIKNFTQIPIMEKIIRKMLANEKLLFVLPAFPAKSPNLDKVSGTTPDLGEVLALKKLNHMCEQISQCYEPGAEVLICSDGRVFSDIVRVSDALIDDYSFGIKEIIRDFNLHHLNTFDMEDAYGDVGGEKLRALLDQDFAQTREQVRHLVQFDADYCGLFNGVHRFMVEDFIGLPENLGLSRTQVAKQAKQSTYELLRRSDAWSILLRQRFPEALRFSIHAYPLQHEKFGISLLPASDRVATPWHNVAVSNGQGYELMHRSVAMAMGARKLFYKEKYAYYEI